jgi:type II secretory ATPase GspE/PulE/Tfp pilus assembly ATPase PilB-like protein
MKVEPFLVASTVNVIIAQRLVRRICDSCKAQVVIKREDILRSIPEELVAKYFPLGDELNVAQGKGCKLCHHTGYLGRIGIYEVLEMTETVKKLIADKNDSDVITREAIKEGMTTMQEDGISKIAKGLTTLGEVLRVTKVEKI